MASQANVFNLHGHHLSITYSTGALGAKHTLVYQDALRTLTFEDAQIRKVATDAGDLVSVTLQLTVDSGSTTFSLLVPRVLLDPNQQAHVDTVGITARHRFSLAPALLHGQLDGYQTSRLRGTASSHAF